MHDTLVLGMTICELPPLFPVVDDDNSTLDEKSNHCDTKNTGRPWIEEGTSMKQNKGTYWHLVINAASHPQLPSESPMILPSLTAHMVISDGFYLGFKQRTAWNDTLK